MDLTKVLDRFYTKIPSSNKKTTTLGMEVPQDFARWVDEISQSPLFPEYKTKSDLLRDCCFLGLNLRTEMRDDLSPALEARRAGLMALAVMQDVQYNRELTDTLIQDLYSFNGDRNHHLGLIEHCKAFVADIKTEADRKRMVEAIESAEQRLTN